MCEAHACSLPTRLPSLRLPPGSRAWEPLSGCRDPCREWVPGEEGGQRVGRGCLDGAGPDGHLCWEGRPETRRVLGSEATGRRCPQEGGWCGAVVLPGRQTPGRERGRRPWGRQEPVASHTSSSPLWGAVGDPRVQSRRQSGQPGSHPGGGPMSRRAPLPQPSQAREAGWCSRVPVWALPARGV